MLHRFNGSFYDLNEPHEFTISFNQEFMVERLPVEATRSGRGWAVRKGGRR